MCQPPSSFGKRRRSHWTTSCHIPSTPHQKLLPPRSHPSAISLGPITFVALWTGPHYSCLYTLTICAATVPFIEHRPYFPSSSLLPSRKNKIPTFVDWHKKPSRMRPLASLFSLILTSFLCNNVCLHHTKQRAETSLMPLPMLFPLPVLFLPLPAATPHLPQDSVWNTALSLGSLSCALTIYVLYPASVASL